MVIRTRLAPASEEKKCLSKFRRRYPGPFLFLSDSEGVKTNLRDVSPTHSSGRSTRGSFRLWSFQYFLLPLAGTALRVGPLSLGFMAISALDFSSSLRSLLWFRTRVRARCPGLELYKYLDARSPLSPASLAYYPLYISSPAMLSLYALTVLAIAAQSFAGVDAAAIRESSL